MDKRTKQEAFEKLTYIAKHGLTLAFHCRCGRQLGWSDFCKECGADNTYLHEAKKKKAEYLKDFKLTKKKAS